MRRIRLVGALALMGLLAPGCVSKEIQTLSAKMKAQTSYTPKAITDVRDAQILMETSAIDALAIELRQESQMSAALIASDSGLARMRANAKDIVKMANHDFPAEYFADHGHKGHADAFVVLQNNVLSDLKGIAGDPKSVKISQNPLVTEKRSKDDDLFKDPVARLTVLSEPGSTSFELFKIAVGWQSQSKRQGSETDVTSIEPSNALLDEESEKHFLLDDKFSGSFEALGFAKHYGLLEEKGYQRDCTKPKADDTQAKPCDCHSEKEAPACTLEGSEVASDMAIESIKSEENLSGENEEYRKLIKQYEEYSAKLKDDVPPLWRVYYTEQAALTVNAGIRAHRISEAKPFVRVASYVAGQGASIDKRVQDMPNLDDFLLGLQALDNVLGLTAVIIAAEN